MNDELTDLLGLGGGSAVAGYAIKALMDRFLRSDEKWRTSVDFTLSKLAELGASTKSTLDVLVERLAFEKASAEKLSERVEGYSKNHSDRISDLEKRVARFEGRQQGLEETLKERVDE